MNLLVYCGAQKGNSEAFADGALQLAHAIAEREWSLVYGGGSVGLMGILAAATLERGCRVTGIIPSFMMRDEVVLHGCTEIVEVSSMHKRKHEMLERCNGILALPGGFGTLEELFEAVTWKQLGLHNKPIGLWNMNGYWNPLSDMLDSMLHSGFISPHVYAHLRVDTELLPLMDWLEQHSSDEGIDPLLPRWS